MSVCLSLGAGKTILIPPHSMIPTGASIAALIQDSGAKALLIVPSILEEIESLPAGKGSDILKRLDFVAFGAGMPKESVGERRARAGMKLVNQYGSTETGPLTNFLVPDNHHNWRRFKLRSGIIGSLQVRIDRLDSDQPQNVHHVSGIEQNHEYKLSLRPFGWQDRFELQDIVVSTRNVSPEDDIADLEFTIAGRTDDLICLATGEKVRPTILESLLREHDGVRDAAAFGTNKFELGVIVECQALLSTADDQKTFRDSVWPIVVEAGRQRDSHARITSPAAVLLVGPGALPRSDKGSIIRKEVEKKFELEIADIYHRLECDMDAPPINLALPRSSIRSFVEEICPWETLDDTWLDDDDFFMLGMDSLQATKLRRSLTASVRATYTKLGSRIHQTLLSADLTADDFIYLHPSVSMLVGALLPQYAANQVSIPEAELFEKLVDKYTLGSVHGQLAAEKAVVLFTGATESLGSFLLENLLKNDAIHRIICLNRPKKTGTPLEVQKSAMNARGITVTDEQWTKVEIRQTKIRCLCLGLETDDYDRLAAQVTHIIHIAWPMSFKMAPGAFSLLSRRSKVFKTSSTWRVQRTCASQNQGSQ